MFGLGDSNKSKLEENMEEIKQMVDGDATGSGDQETQSNQELQEDFSQPEETAKDVSNSFDQPRPEQNESTQNTEQRLQEEIEKFEDKQSGQDNSNVEGPADPKPQVDEGNYSRQEPTQETQSREKAVNAEIPEPAKTRDLDVPEIEKGPLFITRRKFETATRLIYEMRNLSQEIESTVQSMENDIKRSRETEQQVQTILDEFEHDRKDVESIISPK